MKRHEVIDREHLSLEWRALIASAMEARRRAYAPYSNFAVGAAVSTANGRVFSGSNVENASSGLTVCAERVAVWKAISNGERELTALAVVTEPGATPCGACRQVLSEFVEDAPILVANTEGQIWVTSLHELLPYPFPRVALADVLQECEE